MFLTIVFLWVIVWVGFYIKKNTKRKPTDMAAIELLARMSDRYINDIYEFDGDLPPFIQRCYRVKMKINGRNESFTISRIAGTPFNIPIYLQEDLDYGFDNYELSLIFDAVQTENKRMVKNKQEHNKKKFIDNIINEDKKR